MKWETTVGLWERRKISSIFQKGPFWLLGRDLNTGSRGGQEEVITAVQQELGPTLSTLCSAPSKLSLTFHLPTFVRVELFPCGLTFKGFFLSCRTAPFAVTILQFFYKEQVLLLFSEKNKIMLFYKTLVVFILNLLWEGKAVGSFTSFTGMA